MLIAAYQYLIDPPVVESVEPLRAIGEEAIRFLQSIPPVLIVEQKSIARPSDVEIVPTRRDGSIQLIIDAKIVKSSLINEPQDVRHVSIKVDTIGDIGRSIPRKQVRLGE